MRAVRILDQEKAEQELGYFYEGYTLVRAIDFYPEHYLGDSMHVAIYALNYTGTRCVLLMRKASKAWVWWKQISPILQNDMHLTFAQFSSEWGMPRDEIHNMLIDYNPW
jgi:hypothetical protein